MKKYNCSCERCGPLSFCLYGSVGSEHCDIFFDFSNFYSTCIRESPQFLLTRARSMSISSSILGKIPENVTETVLQTYRHFKDKDLIIINFNNRYIMVGH